jgi:NAD(P)-dependent dehydrogenase (short-subunit alcohol dehydrogenase family)
VTADFAGQTALVTGGNTGIGRAVAGQPAACGAHVLISGRDPGRGHAVRAAVAECGGAADFVAERAPELGQAGGRTRGGRQRRQLPGLTPRSYVFGANIVVDGGVTA